MAEGVVPAQHWRVVFNQTDVGVVGADVDESAWEEGLFHTRTAWVICQAVLEPVRGHFVGVGFQQMGV